MTKTQYNGMRAITADCGTSVSGTIAYDDDDDVIEPPVRFARSSSHPQLADVTQQFLNVTQQLRDATRHHSEMTISLAHERVMREIDHAIGRLTRVEFDAMLSRVVHSIARRRPQRDNG